MDHRFEIRRISIWPAARLAFVILLVIGILVAILYATIIAGLGLIAGALGPSALGEDFGLLRNLGLFMIPVIAISYAVFGTVGIVVWLLLYNLLASIIGGVEVSLNPKGGGTIGVNEPPFHVAGRTEDQVT